LCEKEEVSISKKEQGSQPPKRKQLSSDAKVMIELLTDLSGQEREAFIRFYVDGHPPDQIESALGLDEYRFQNLRCSVKAAFFKRTGRGL
jgi:hypothetical protein